jgi:very-short-patch-repair endonuclease
MTRRRGEKEPEGPIRRAESSPEIRMRARELRRTLTPGERLLWQALRNRRFLGLKFRVQHPLGPFIADFYCAARRLAVEVDGAVHRDPVVHGHDQARDAWLRARGVRVLRLSAKLVEQDLPRALCLIAAALAAPPDTPD